MATDIKAYRVFIASPGGLEDARRIFRATITNYNDTDAIKRRVLFIPTGWEDTLGGFGRPQTLINEDVCLCDYFVLVLWDRWGSSPDPEGRGSGRSATEEEYHLALDCREDPQRPMRQVLVFFKALDPRQLSDPGPQLQKVLGFKRTLEAEKTLMFGTFDQLAAFEGELRRYLAQWVRDHEAGRASSSSDGESQPLEAGLPASAMQASTGSEASGKSELTREAERMAGEGRLTEAEIAFAQAAVRGDDLDAINGYGLFLRSRGRNEQAQMIFNRVFQLALQRNDKLWQAASLNNRALVNYDQGNYNEAEPLFRDALEIRRKVLGARHPDYATSLNNLAVLYYDQGKYSDAERLFKESASIRRDVLGEAHPDVAKSLNRLADLCQYHDRGRPGEAEQLYKEALAIQEKALGANHPDIAATLNNLAELNRRRGDFDQAERLFKRALKIREEALGVSHPDVAWSVNGLAALYRDRGKHVEAELLYKRAIEMREKALGPTHPDLAWSLSDLAGLYADRDRLTEAEALCKRALAIREKALSSFHPDLAISWENYAAVLRKLGREGEADALDGRARAIRSQHVQ